jgi:hypothetical protein
VKSTIRFPKSTQFEPGNSFLNRGLLCYSRVLQCERGDSVLKPFTTFSILRSYSPRFPFSRLIFSSRRHCWHSVDTSFYLTLDHLFTSLIKHSRRRWIERVLEGCGRSSIYGNIPEFVSTDWRRTWQVSIRLAADWPGCHMLLLQWNERNVTWRNVMWRNVTPNSET